VFRMTIIAAFASIIVMTGEVAAQSGSERARSLETNFWRAIEFNNKAHILTLKGEYDHAIEAASEAIRLLPEYGTAYNNLGFAYLQKGEYDQAIAALNNAIRIIPRQPVFLNSRGKAYLMKGNYDAALVDLNESIRLMPSYSHAFNNRGTVYKKKGDLDRAIADYSEALRLKPDSADVIVNRGNAYKEQGKDDLAKADLNEAERLIASRNLSRNERWKAALRKFLIRDQVGDPDKAIADLAEVIRQKPDYAPALIARASAYAAKGELDSAIGDYTVIIQHYPKEPEVYLRRATAYLLKDELYPALDDLVAAIRIGRDYTIHLLRAVKEIVGEKYKGIGDTSVAIRTGGAQALLFLSAKYLKQGRYKDAIISLNQVIEQAPASVDAYLLRGTALIGEGDIERGAMDLKEAARLAR